MNCPPARIWVCTNIHYLQIHTEEQLFSAISKELFDCACVTLGHILVLLSWLIPVAAVLVRDESPLQLRHGESSCSAPIVGSCRPIVLHRCLVRCRSATHGATIGRGRSTHVGQLGGLGEGHKGEARCLLKGNMTVTAWHTQVHMHAHTHTQTTSWGWASRWKSGCCCFQQWFDLTVGW